MGKSSGVQGVFYCNSKDYWIANISVDRVITRLVSTKDKFEAICSRKSAEARIESGEKVFDIDLKERRRIQAVHNFKLNGSVRETANLMGVNVQTIYRTLANAGYKFRA